MCHKCGLGNHYAKDCQADPPVKPKVMDFAYYDRKAQELAASEKAFVSIVSLNVDGYWSSVDKKEYDGGRNMCLIDPHEVRNVHFLLVKEIF